VGALLSGIYFWNPFVTASRETAREAAHARRVVPNALLFAEWFMPATDASISLK
jgi:hypothetical protein